LRASRQHGPGKPGQRTGQRVHRSRALSAMVKGLIPRLPSYPGRSGTRERKSRKSVVAAVPHPATGTAAMQQNDRRGIVGSGQDPWSCLSRLAVVPPLSISCAHGLRT
jgi:hypothetical protein